MKEYRQGSGMKAKIGFFLVKLKLTNRPQTSRQFQKTFQSPPLRLSPWASASSPNELPRILTSSLPLFDLESQCPGQDTPTLHPTLLLPTPLAGQPSSAS